MPGEDAVILKDENVTITKTLAVVCGVSYPTNTISAISVKKIYPFVGMAAFALLLVPVGLICLNGHEALAGLAILLAAALMLYFAVRPKLSLVVRSAGTDSSVLKSRDRAYLEKVQRAIEEAVRQRG